MQRVGEFEIRRVVESEVPFIEPNVFLPDFTALNTTLTVGGASIERQAA